MKIEMYSSENYESFEDAKKQGALYSFEPDGIEDSNAIAGALADAILCTQNCLIGEYVIRHRIVEA